jgi:hypothetical protein
LKLPVGFAVVLILAAAAASLVADDAQSKAAFERLASLRGQWTGEMLGVRTRLIYTLTANGSALMEQCRPVKGHEMITMFTIDGDHLIATHYCSAKNQPQMTTQVITDAQGPLAFSLVRVTGLKSPDDFHNTGLTVIQEDNNHLTQEWSYESRGKSGKNIFRFTRVREDSEVRK